MRPPIHGLVLFSVCCGLSCSIWTTPPTAPELTAHPRSGPQSTSLGPDRRQWLEALLLEYQTGLAPFEVGQLAATILSESERLELDLDLVLAVIRIESGFHAFARSPVGALGLMQVMPETGQMLARQLGIEWQGSETLFDPVVNVRLGTQYLADLYERYSDWDSALAAYNWGPRRIDRRLRAGQSLPGRYVRHVMAQLHSPRFP